jgi:hypothetical protein
VRLPRDAGRDVAAPVTSGHELQRCCATWVARGRSDEAITRVLHLAESRSSDLELAWELLGTVCLALACVASDQIEMGGTLRRVISAASGLVDLGQTTNRVAGSTGVFGVGLERLLRSCGASDREELVSLLQSGREVLEVVGRIGPGEPIADVADELAPER